MKIFRAIFANNIDEIDIDNFGCHWTNNEWIEYDTNFRYNDISGGNRKGDNLYKFEANVSKEFIHQAATKKSNREYPNESEVVLLQNTIIENVIVKTISEDLIFKINTGNRCAKWYLDLLQNCSKEP